MPEYIGPIEIPVIAASGTFPATVHFGSARRYEPEVMVHQFATENCMVEQRFYRGDGLRRLSLNCAAMNSTEKAALVAFLEARKGSYQPFTLAWKENDGTSTNLTVRLEAPAAALQRAQDGQWSASIDVIEEPGTAPTYTVAETLSRFPSAGLATALLEQVQEVIPLVTITAGAHTIRLSDRRVTIGGNLYQPRILSWDGISQSLGEASDIASFTFGNADRVFTGLVNAVDLDRAQIAFAVYGVATGSLVNLWTGHIQNWDMDATGEFRVQARDGVSALRLAYPRRTINRQDGFEVGAQPVSVGGKKGIARFTATSVANDTAYGKALKDAWVNNFTDPLPVPCDVIAGRDESEFYAALGVVGRGPLSAFGSGHTLDNALNHGPGALGLRLAYGGNPADGTEALTNNKPDQGSNWFQLDDTGTSWPQADSGPTGVAFLQIRRTDEKGVQALRPGERQMVAYVAQGLGGWTWTAPLGVNTRAWTASLTNRIWIAINTYLNALGLSQASQSAQEATFDVASAIAAAAICDSTVDKLIGTGTETQFVFTGIVGSEERTLTDWLRDILAGCLGYYTVAAGKLKVGIRVNSSTVEAFTTGNIIYNSLKLASRTPEYNHLTVGFADEAYAYQGNTLTLKDDDHITASGQTLKANINLLGVTSKSQAARVCTVAFREAMGGLRYTGTVNTSGTAVTWVSGTKFVTGMDGQPFVINGTAYTVDAVTDDQHIVLTATAGTQSGVAYSAGYELVQARRGSFRTTILALNVEPGMVCSLTHPEMPNGAGEFRIQSWRLNSDWSIDVEWVSTWDSMYDTAIGPKPDDVAPDEIPSRPIYDIEFGATTGSNLLRNPGFERGIVGWHGLDIPTTGWEIVTTGQDTGRKALKISYAGACELHQPLGFEDDGFDTYPCVPGDPFTFKGRYKFAAASAATTAQARIAFYQADGAFLSAETATLGPTNTAWTDFSLSATAPALAKYMGIFPWFGTLTAGAVYLDTLYCEKTAASGVLPGHVSFAGVATPVVEGVDQIELRAQIFNQFFVTAKAPSPLNGFNAVFITHADVDSIVTPIGRIAVDSPTAGSQFTVSFIHNAPKSTTTETITVLAASDYGTADPATAPTATVDATGKGDGAAPPTGVTCTINEEDGGKYSITTAWTKPAAEGGVVGYELWWEFYDAVTGLSFLITPFGGEDVIATVKPGQQLGYDTQTHTSAPADRGAAQWVRSFVRSYSAFGKVSAWAYSTVTVLDGESVPQPAVGDWAIVQPTAGDGYGNDGLNQKVRLRINVIAIPTGADYVTAWVVMDGTYKDMLSANTTGNHDIWIDQPRTATTYDCKLVGNRRDAVKMPSAANDVKTFSVAAWALALQATAFTVTLDTLPKEDARNGMGKDLYRLKYEVTLPADVNRMGVAIEARWTNSSWVPVAGNDGEWNEISWEKSSLNTVTWYGTPDYSFSAPPPGETNYKQFRAVPKNYANEKTTAGAITVNSTFTSDGGWDPRVIDPTLIGPGLVVDTNGIGSLSRGLLNGDFENQLEAWLADTGWTADDAEEYSGSYCAKGNATLVGGVARALIQTVKCVPGMEYRLQAYVKNSCNGLVSVLIGFQTPAGSYIGSDGVFAAGGDAWTLTDVTATAPATAGLCLVWFQMGASCTTGRVLVDNVQLIPVEPLGSGMVRTGDGVASTSRDLKNGDFEDLNPDGTFADWTVTAGVTVNTADKYSGTNCAQITALNGAYRSIAQSVPAVPGRQFRWQVYARETVDGGAFIDLAFYDAAGGYIATGAVYVSIVGDTWALYEAVSTAPALAASVRVEVLASNDSTTGRILVDQCQLIALEPTGSGVTRDAAGVKATERGLKNGDFEFPDGKDWTFTSGVTFTATDAYKGTAANLSPAGGVDQTLYQELPAAPGQVVQFEAYAKESGNSTSKLCLRWHDAGGSYIAASEVAATITGDAYALYRVVATAPATAASVRCQATFPAANTSGRLMIDQANAKYLEPTGGGMTRTSAGIVPDLNTSGALLVDGGGKLTNYAVTELARYGFNSSHFESDGSNLVIKAAVIDWLLARSITVTSDLTITRSSSGGVVAVNGDGVKISKGNNYVQATSTGIAFSDGTNNATIYSIPSFGYALAIAGMAIGGSALTYISDASVILGSAVLRVKATSLIIDDPGAWRTALDVAQKLSITATTLPLAKITPGGTDGALGLNAAGQVTGWTAPT